MDNDFDMSDALNVMKKEANNLTGAGLAENYFLGDNKEIFVALPALDVFNEKPNYLLALSHGEDFFIYKEGQKVEGKAGDFLVEDKDKNRFIVEREKFQENYKMEMESGFNKSELKEEFLGEKPKSSIRKKI